jgi:glycosyltransferase involved in cell wall biosynthesis
VQPIKVLFVSPSFYPATYYGGPTFVNKGLCDALATNSDVELRVLTTDANGPRGRVSNEAQSGNRNYQTVYCRRFIQPDIAPGLLLRLFGMVRRADVVHLNAVYSFTTIPALALCCLLKKPVVWSLHAALQTWPGREPTKLKRIWEKACNFFCDQRRVLLHTVSPREESESTRAMSRARSVVIQYGIEATPLERCDEEMSGPMRLLFLGRLHPIKGIENLLQALSLGKENVMLDVCGEGDEAYEAQLRALVLKLGLVDRVRFHGGVSGEAKVQCFAQADLCIVPSFTEGFATVVAEALAHGVPVIASKGTPWREIEEKGCGLYVSNEPRELAAAIDRASAMPLNEMGERGRAWIERDFAWKTVAVRMINQYQMLLRREPREETEKATCPKAA